MVQAASTGDQTQIATNARVKIEGKYADGVETNLVDALIVEQDLNQPDMATITFDDNSREFSGEVRLGSWLKVQLGRNGEDDLSSETEDNLVFEGEIVAVEPRFGAEGKSICVVRAFDKLHQLSRGRYSQSWEGQPEKDILQQVIDRGGYDLELSCDLDNQVTHVYQHNQTDLEFILHRASQYGARVFVEGSKLRVEKPNPKKNEGKGITLDMEKGADYELTIFAPRMSAAELVASVEVRGWDPTKKEEITSDPITPESSSLNHGHLGKFLAPKAAGKLGEAVTYAVDSPVFDKPEAVAKAESILWETMMSFITGSGVCIGRPALRAGQVVKVRTYDKSNNYHEDYRFNGSYLLTGVSHRYTYEENGQGGYKALVRFRRDAEVPKEGGGGEQT